ncbi:MAG: hypothetical protein WBD53_08515 [Xanthobacteraceae bacterium]
MLADMGRDFKPADILGVDQKIGGEIAVNKVVTAMNEPIERLVKAATPLVPPQVKKFMLPHSACFRALA